MIVSWYPLTTQTRTCCITIIILWTNIMAADLSHEKDLLSASLVNSSLHDIQENDDVIKQQLTQYGVHYDLQSVLQTLRDPKFESEEAVQVLLMKFEEAKQVAPNSLPPRIQRHPIIAIEGFFTHGRTAISKMVSNAFNGRRLQLPTRNVNRMRKYFTNDFLRKHFYSLSKYMAAQLVLHYCRTAPVILERYWHDQAVYVMARSFEGLIPATSSVYKFPKDLVVPDFVFFINGALNPNMYNASTANEHIHNELTVKMVEIFRRMRDPALIEIFPPGMAETMGPKIIDFLEKKIPGNFCPKPLSKPVTPK